MSKKSFSKTLERPPLEMPTEKEDRAITAAAESDPDALPLTSDQLKAMVPLRALRGHSKAEHKKLLVSVRNSPELIACFKASGKGWQSRIDGVLHEFGARQSPSACEPEPRPTRWLGGAIGARQARTGALRGPGGSNFAAHHPLY